MARPTGKKKRRPTDKQKKLITLLAAGASRKTAVELAGYSTKYPSQSVDQALRGLSLSFPELMDKHGLTDSHLIEQHLKPLLKARRVKHFAHNGQVKSKRVYADNDTRLTALDLAFRLKGSFAPIKNQNESRSVDVIVVDIPRPIHLPDDDENTGDNSGSIAAQNGGTESK
jgi:hypothetical protein